MVIYWGTEMNDIPQWFIALHYDGISDDELSKEWRIYRSYREEGHTQYYALVHMGLNDPYYGEEN